MMRPGPVDRAFFDADTNSTSYYQIGTGMGTKRKFLKYAVDRAALRIMSLSGSGITNKRPTKTRRGVIADGAADAFFLCSGPLPSYQREIYYGQGRE